MLWILLINLAVSSTSHATYKAEDGLNSSQRLLKCMDYLDWDFRASRSLKVIKVGPSLRALPQMRDADYAVIVASYWTPWDNVVLSILRISSKSLKKTKTERLSMDNSALSYVEIDGSELNVPGNGTFEQLFSDSQQIGKVWGRVMPDHSKPFDSIADPPEININSVLWIDHSYYAVLGKAGGPDGSVTYKLALFNRSGPTGGFNTGLIEGSVARGSYTLVQSKDHKFQLEGRNIGYLMKLGDFDLYRNSSNTSAAMANHISDNWYLYNQVYVLSMPVLQLRGFYKHGTPKHLKKEILK